MTNWKGIRHQVLDRLRNARSSSKRKGKRKDKRKKEIMPQEAVALTASIIIIIMALGGISLVYNVFAQLKP